MTLALAVVLAMQKMATIVAFVVMTVAAFAVVFGWRRVMCPPVRMV
ncbi:hypothetical protein [Streptomyces pluripotens]|nr:hypothetical protein [Streptomyces pluripotens]